MEYERVISFRRASTTGLFVIAAIAVVASIALYSWHASAASVKYPFLIRGTVEDISRPLQQFRVYGTHTSAAARAEFAGHKQLIDVRGAEFYKYDADGNKIPTTFAVFAAVGDEVVIRGTAFADGTNKATWVVTNGRNFDVVGKVFIHNTDTMKMTIDVETSTHRQADLKGTNVIFEYTDDTKFYLHGKQIQADEVPDSDQYVKIRAKRISGRWVITTLWDSYK